MEVTNVPGLKRLKKGDFVTLTDERTLILQMKAGLGLKPVDRKINQIETIEANGGLAQIIICDITGESESFRKIIFAKIVDDAFDVRVYDEDPKFLKGNRDDLMKNASLWVSDTEHVFFDQPPEFKGANDLRYTGAFATGDLTYIRKQPGEYDGEFRQHPAASGINYPLLATVCEYALEAGKQTNPEVPNQALFLEVGPVESDLGGLVTLWYGHEIKNNEFQVLAC